MFLKSLPLLISLFEAFNFQNSLSVKFTRKDNVIIIPQAKEKALISSIQKESRLMCNVECSLDSRCFISIMNGQICELYNITARDYLIIDQNYKQGVYIKDLKQCIHSGLNIRNGIQNYWPIDGSTIDVIGHMNMTIQLNGQLSTDRFGNPDSALRLSKGYASVPAGIYFDPATGFTFMAWVKIITLNDYQRIFDFGSGPDTDTVLLTNIGTTGQLRLAAFVNSNFLVDYQNPLELNKWYHIAASVSGNTATLYVDGVDQGVKSGIVYRAVERTNNFFGKSNSGNSRLFDGTLDDVKIFKRGLNKYEIAVEMYAQRSFVH